MTAWLVAAVIAGFAVLRSLDPTPGMWKFAAINWATAPLFASLPLLHRFGEMLAPIAFVVLAYSFIFVVTSLVGTAGGTWMYYFIATATGIIFLGTERYFATALLSLTAIGLILLLHIIVPQNTGALSPNALFFGNFVINVVASSLILFGIVFYALRQSALAEEMAEREYNRSESLLSNILPADVAARLKQRADVPIADAYPEASILFADMAGFTSRVSDTTPSELVNFLNFVFSKLDGLVERHRLEKIKTTGDAYMVVSGVPKVCTDHACKLAALALDMRQALAGLVDPKGREVPVRIGIASGPVVAGVIGTTKFFYDVWGDAVNVASRMESTGVAGKIQIAESTREQIAQKFNVEERGTIEVRGKGLMQTWFLIGRNDIC
jgi:adenylate cyclase